MQEDHKLLKLILAVAAVLAILLALWRVLSYEKIESQASVPAARFSVGENRPTTTWQTEKERELLGESREEPVQPVVTRVPLYRTTLPASNQGTVAPVKTPYAQRTSLAGGKRYVPAQPSSQNTSSYPVPATSQTYVSGGRSESGNPQVHFVSSSSQSKIQEERARMLAPYLRPNRKDKERMEAQWNQLSAALERAVAKALMPKSTKETLIEKYAPQSSLEQTSVPGFSGALTPVGQQLAVQKQEVVKNFASAFGSSAARQAGGLMDSFAGELANALNAPNTTAAQKEAQVKSISKKYQKEMDKLVEKNQYDKFVADRIAQDNKQKESLRSRYQDANLNAKFGQIIDAAREKDLALATQTDLPREQYYTQLAQNNQDMRNQLKQAIVEAGQSVNPLQELEQKQAQEFLTTLKQQEEEGKIMSFARQATAQETMQMKKDVAVQRNDILDKLKKSPAFGEQAAQEFTPILDAYEQKLDQLYMQKLSPAQRKTAEINLLKDVNRQLLDKQMEQVEKMNIPEVQKKQALEELRQAYNAIE